MGDDITIGVTEIVNNIEVTAQPNDQVIDINVTDNSDEVTLNVTPNVIEVNINKGSSFARWGTIYGNILDQVDLTNALFNKADLVDGKVPSYQLPSFVDDVIEVANYAALPTVGETGKIYITLDNNKIYRWSGSIYIEIASNQAIWGAITGTLSSQTDLSTALNEKALKTTTISTNAPLSGGGDLSANRTLSITQSGVSSDGYLISTDWNTFNNKQNQLNGTGFVKATGTTISYDNTSYLPLTGGTVTGTLNVDGSGATTPAITSIFNTGINRLLTPVLRLYGPDNIGSKYIELFGSLATTNRTIQFPDASGTAILGSGTTNYIPKFTSANIIANSLIYDNGTNISIGTSSPNSYLAGTIGTVVYHSSSPAYSLANSTTYWLNYLSGSEYRFFNPTNSVVHTIYLNGNYSFSGTNVSDIRLKEDVENLNINFTEKILGLNPKSYYIKDSRNRKHYGFIAQEVYETIPDIISGDIKGEDYLGVDYNGIIAILVGSIKELKAEIEILKQK